jgi:hypothetical protein
VFAPDQFPGQIYNRAATTLAAVNRPASAYSHNHHSTVKLDIERQMNHTRFGPKSFKDCRKMGNDVILQFVLNHTSRMALSGAVLEAYMTLTADLGSLVCCSSLVTADRPRREALRGHLPATLQPLAKQNP